MVKKVGCVGNSLKNWFECGNRSAAKKICLTKIKQKVFLKQIIFKFLQDL